MAKYKMVSGYCVPFFNNLLSGAVVLFAPGALTLEHVYIKRSLFGDSVRNSIALVY